MKFERSVSYVSWSAAFIEITALGDNASFLTAFYDFTKRVVNIQKEASDRIRDHGFKCDVS